MCPLLYEPNRVIPFLFEFVYRNAEDYRIKLGMFSQSKDDAEQVLRAKRLVMVGGI